MAEKKSKTGRNKNKVTNYLTSPWWSEPGAIATGLLVVAFDLDQIVKLRHDSSGKPDSMHGLKNPVAIAPGSDMLRLA